MDILKEKLPSFMRKKYLKEMIQDNKLHHIYYENKVVGFYVLDEEKFKCLYVRPDYRGLGLSTRIIENIIQKQQITICVTRKSCAIKKLIKRLKFTPMNKIVEGKNSPLEIWISPRLI